MSKDDFFQGFEPVRNLDGTPIEVKGKEVVPEPKSPISEPITPVSRPKPPTSGSKPSMPEPKPPIAVPKPPTPGSKPPTPSTTPTPESASHPSDGLTRKGEKELLRSEKKQTRAITIIAVAVAAVVAVALSVFFASGGVTRLQLCHTWSCFDARGQLKDTIEFRFAGTGYEKEESIYFSEMSIPFEYHLKADKTLTMTATGGFFGLADGMAVIFRWDKQAKTGGEYWYIEDGVLYMDGDAYYKNYYEQGQKNLLSDKKLEEEIRSKADRYMQEHYGDFEFISVEQDGVRLDYSYLEQGGGTAFGTETRPVKLTYNTLEEGDPIVRESEWEIVWDLVGEWACKDDKHDDYLRISRLDGEKVYVVYSLHHQNWPAISVNEDVTEELEAYIDTTSSDHKYSIVANQYKNYIDPEVFEIITRGDDAGLYFSGVKLIRVR